MGNPWSKSLVITYRPWVSMLFQGFMGAVTQGFVARSLTGTKIFGARFLGPPVHRSKARGLVGAVTKRLIAAQAAGTPVVGLAGLDLYGQRGFLYYLGLLHNFSSCIESLPDIAGSESH